MTGTDRAAGGGFPPRRTNTPGWIFTKEAAGSDSVSTHTHTRRVFLCLRNSGGGEEVCTQDRVMQTHSICNTHTRAHLPFRQNMALHSFGSKSSKKQRWPLPPLLPYCASPLLLLSFLFPSSFLLSLLPRPAFGSDRLGSRADPKRAPLSPVTSRHPPSAALVL